MNYESKYNELVEAVRAVVEANRHLCNFDKGLGRLRDLLPEKESEDERIRQEIHAFLFNTLHNTQTLTPRTNELERWLAYLEKQKEQKQPEVDLEKLGEIARHLIAVKYHEEGMRLDKDEWLLIERIGYPERFNARKEE